MRWVDRECSCLNCCIDKLESALTHLKNSRFDSEFNRLAHYDQNTKAADFLARHLRKLIKGEI